MFKLRGLQDFSFQEDGNERGSGVREKARLLVDLMSDQSKLEQEREKSRQIRSKFVGMSGEGTYHYQERNYGNYGGGGGGGGYGNYNNSSSQNYKDRIQGFGSETSSNIQQGSSNYQNQRRDNEWSKGYGGFIEPQGNVEEREKQRKTEWQQQQQQRKDQNKINFSIKPTQTANQQIIVKPAPQTQQQQTQPTQNQNKITIQPKTQTEVQPIKQEQQQPQQQAVSLIDFDVQPTQQQQAQTNQNQNLLESLFENPVQTQNTQLLFPNQQQKQQEQQNKGQEQERNEKINQITSLFNQNQQVTFPSPTQPNLFPGQQIPGMQQPGFAGPQQIPMQGFPGQPPMYYNQVPQQQWGYQQPHMMYPNVGFQQPMQGIPQAGYTQQQYNVPSNLKNQGQNMKTMPPGQTNQPQKQPQQKTKQEFESSIKNLDFL